MRKAIRFTANWCNPCKQYAPKWDAVASKRDDWEFIVIDVDTDIEKAKEYGIRNIPATVLVNDGNILFKQTGIIEISDLEIKLDEHLQD